MEGPGRRGHSPQGEQPGGARRRHGGSQQPGRCGSRERATQEAAGLCGASRQDLTSWGLGASDGFCVVRGRSKRAVGKVMGKTGWDAAGGWRTWVGEEQWRQHKGTLGGGVCWGERGSKGTPLGSSLVPSLQDFGQEADPSHQP